MSVSLAFVHLATVTDQAHSRWPRFGIMPVWRDNHCFLTHESMLGFIEFMAAAFGAATLVG